MPILARRKPGAVITYMGAFAHGGALLEEPRFAGITSLAMRCSIKGTTTRDANQISEDSEMLGGVISPSTGSERFGWSISVPGARSAEAADLLADVVQNATVPDKVFETEQSIMLSDIARFRDDMYGYPMQLAVSAAFRDHPYGVPTIGAEGTVGVLNAVQVRNWYRSKLLRAPFVLAIVGDDDPEAMANMLAARFQSLQPGEKVEPAKPEWPKEVRVDSETRDKAQTALVIAYDSPTRTDNDRFVTQMIATIASGLGGRFFDELRDKQSLAYTVHSFVSEKQKAGMFMSYIATSPEKEGVARDGLLREIAKLRNELVTPEELEQGRKYTIGTHAIRQESGGAVMADMLDAYMLGSGLQELDEFEARVNGVTREKILEVAQHYFKDENRVEGIIKGSSTDS